VHQVPERYRAYQSQHKTKEVVEQWNVQMDQKDYKGKPLRHRTPFVQAFNIWIRLQDALLEMPNPFTEAIRNKALDCGMPEAVSPVCASKLAQGDWLGAILELLEAIEGTDAGDADIQETRNKLYDHWRDTYGGDSLEGIRMTIQNCEKEWPSVYGTCYSKSINIFQSSGMGKSRLADELGKSNLEFSFVFRKPGDSGYPPGDPEITNYFRGASHASILAASFYAAIGKIGDS
jgi:hypothetical protein